MHTLQKSLENNFRLGVKWSGMGHHRMRVSVHGPSAAAGATVAGYLGLLQRELVVVRQLLPGNNPVLVTAHLIRPDSGEIAAWT